VSEVDGARPTRKLTAHEKNQAQLARQAAASVAGLYPRAEARLRLLDGRVVFALVVRVAGDVLTVRPYGCSGTMEVKRPEIKQASQPLLLRYSAYRVVCSRQRRGEFIAPSAADEKPFEPSEW
jgi:hypothetical protein